MDEPDSLANATAASNRPVLVGLPPLYDEDQVAAYLEVSVRTLQRRRSEKLIPWHEIGGKPKYTPNDVLWILDHAQCNPELLKTTESFTESPTSTPSSVATPARRSTSSGARRGGPSGALLAAEILNQPSEKRAR